MYSSRLLFVTFVIAVVLHSILAQTQPQCSSIRRKSCTSKAECACSGPRRFICNYNNQCNQISLIDIMRRQRPCPNIFKKSCSTDLDCPCKKANYICEDNECVIRRSKPRKNQY